MESILLLANVSVEIIVWRRLLLAKNGVLLYYSPTDYFNFYRQKFTG